MTSPQETIGHNSKRYSYEYMTDIVGYEGCSIYNGAKEVDTPFAPEEMFLDFIPGCSATFGSVHIDFFYNSLDSRFPPNRLLITALRSHWQTS